ncbi:unnamed protein product, partial [Didymodactylos carnosus]
TVFDRLMQAEHEFEKLLTLSERLAHDIPTEQFDIIQRSVQRRQERLQTLIKSCSNSKLKYEQMLKTQHKLYEELLSIIDWLKRLMNDLSSPIELNLSVNSVNDAQDSVTQLISSIEQRTARLEQILHDEPTLISDKEETYTQEIREQDIHQRMTQFLKATNDVKTAVCDADFKLAPFFDGYDRARLDLHEQELE